MGEETVGDHRRSSSRKFDTTPDQIFNQPSMIRRACRSLTPYLSAASSVVIPESARKRSCWFRTILVTADGQKISSLQPPHLAEMISAMVKAVSKPTIGSMASIRSIARMGCSSPDRRHSAATSVLTAYSTSEEVMEVMRHLGHGRNLSGTSGHALRRILRISTHSRLFTALTAWAMDAFCGTLILICMGAGV